MNKGNIKQIIEDQSEEKESILGTGKIIERTQLDFWEQYMKTDLVKVSMGVRRSGKTVFTHLLLRGREYAYVNFDDERLAFTGKDDLNNILEGLYEIYGDFKYLLMEEVQNIKGWELFVNRLQRKRIKIFVTGSNANLLSRELSTHLTGRFLRMELYPFSFREYLLYNDIKTFRTTTKGRAELKSNLIKYLETGGFPEVVAAPGIKNIYLPTLYSSIITRDIIARYNIRFVSTFREMAATLLSNFSSPITFNKLSKVHSFKSPHTAKNYVEYLSDAYLLFLLDKYSPKPKEIANSPKKAYAVDTGLIDSMSRAASRNKGPVIENLVYIELLRKKALDPSMEIFYWKDYQDREIDFVIRRKKRIEELLQVTYSTDINDVEKREIRSLERGSEVLRCKNLTVITWDLEGEEVTGNRCKIRFKPLWKWLLDIK